MLVKGYAEELDMIGYLIDYYVVIYVGIVMKQIDNNKDDREVFANGTIIKKVINIMPKELTFMERNDLFMRYDKLTSVQRTMLINKHMGAMFVLCDDPIYWSKFEEYLAFYESSQTDDSLTFMETVEKITRKYYPLDLTGGGKTDNL